MYDLTKSSMLKFGINVKEVNYGFVEIEAKSQEVALEKAMESYFEGNVHWGNCDTEYWPTGQDEPINLPCSVANDIKVVLGYLWHDEQKSFQESDSSDNHIFNTLKKLRNYAGLSEFVDEDNAEV